MRLDQRLTYIRSRSLDRSMVLHQYAIVDYRNVRMDHHLTVLIELRRGVNNAVRLPLTRAHRCIYQRHRLLIDRTRLSVGISRIVIAIEYLQFINTLHEHTAVTTSLSIAIYFRRRAPFDVQLVVAKC